MKFLNPAGLWLLLLIPALIIIYIIRARHEERSVSSTFIWKLSANFVKHKLPFHRFRKILLFACQLLMVTAVALLAARPAVVTEGGAEEYVIILDASASMRMENAKGESRFDRACDEINSLAASSLYGTKFTVIAASEEASTLIQRTDSNSELMVALDGATCGNGTADLTEALELVNALCAEYPITDVILYTDRPSEEVGNVAVVDVSTGEYNVSFTSLTFEKGEEGYLFTGEVIATSDTVINAALSADGTIFDVKKIACPKDTPVTVTFEVRNLADFNVATVYTDTKDGLADDNSYSACKKRDDKIEVVIVSESPFYLKKVFDTMENCNVYTMSPDNVALLAYGGYGLYVFDCAAPLAYPKDGTVWCFNPGLAPSDMVLTDKKGGEGKLTLSSGNVSPLYHSLSSSLLLESAALRSYSKIVAGKSWESLLSSGGDTVLFARKEKNGTKSLVFAFDLHESNLPLLADFPLLVQELLAYSFPEMLSDSDYDVSESVELSVLPLSNKLYVKTPDGKVLNLSTKTASASLIPDGVGVYTAAQTLSTKDTKYVDFFVHLPLSELVGEGTLDPLFVNLPALDGEGDDGALIDDGASIEETTEDGMTLDDAMTLDEGVIPQDGIKEIRFWVILVLFLLILTEWGVYYYEQF